MSHTTRSKFASLTALAGGVGCALLLAGRVLAADGFQPVPLPDPGIPGFRFPEAEDTILQWTETNNQTAINQHAWGIWTALTMNTDQMFGGQTLRVFETWPTPADILAGGTDASQPRGSSPRQLQRLRQHTKSGVQDHGETTILGFVKYDPTAAGHIIDNNLLSKQALNKLLAAGQAGVPDFPVTAISLKPVFQTIAQGDLVDGRYYQLAAWPGPPGNTPPGPSEPFPSTAWGQCVWVDIQNGGEGTGDVDKTCDPQGGSRTPQTTYNVDGFINFVLSAGEAKLMNAQNLAQWQQAVKQAQQDNQPSPPKPNALAQGDFAILLAMHVTSREITRWTWQTFWWEPNPDQPHFPSSPAIANDRPSQLTGAPRNYAHAPAYSMEFPPQPNTGGQNVGNSIYAYNPWLEAGFSPTDLPDSLPGTYNGMPVKNDVGIMTNCMSCHGAANYNPNKVPNAPDYSGDRYIDLDDPRFKGTLKVDFLWSIPGNAK